MALWQPAFCAAIFAPENPDTRKPLVYGISAKPFPAIAGLDYPFSRAEAWLASLTRANSHLPELNTLRLHLPGPDYSLARLALCALAFPLDVVTPQTAPGSEIRVFRKWPDDLKLAIERALARPWLLELEMAIIWETARAVSDLRGIWPDSVAAAARDSLRLQEMRALLDELWQAAEFNEIAKTGRPVSWVSAFNRASASAAILFAMAGEDPGNMQFPLEKALAMFMEREVGEPDTADLWKRLAGAALYLRGLQHQAAAQSGLARADFGAALARLRAAGADPEPMAEILLGRAALERDSGDLSAMCADLEAACSLGQCAGLAQARREGSCKAASQ